MTKPCSFVRLPLVALCGLALFVGAAGCGGAGGGNAFAHIYADNDASQVDEIVRRLSSAATSADEPVALGLTETHLFAFDLRAGRELWREPVTEPRGEALLAGSLVILHEGERVIARRLRDGTAAFDVADDRFSLVGAGGEGAVGAFVLSTTGGVGAESRLFITSGDGISRRYDVEFPLGAPTVAAGMVFVPWGHQNITVIDAATGAEMARIRTLAGVVGHARVVSGALFFGQAGLGRLTAGMGAEPEEIGWVQPDVEPLPGSPPFFRSAYDPPANARSATHRIELVWAPTPSEGAVTFTDDTIYLTFYKLVFGLSAEDLTVRWAHQLDADAVGAAAREGGVMIADASGGLTYLAAADGRARWTGSLGAEPTVVSFRLGTYEPTGGAAGEEPGPLAVQLLAAVQNTDARLVPGRAFAVRALAAQPDAAVTEHIIVLCDDPSLPQPLRAASCEALSGRDTGSESVLRALQRHASFLEGTQAPPAGALASAAARMNERQAVPLLVSHLRDADTRLGDIPQIAAGLAALGDRGAVEPLRDYLWLYHADGDDPQLAAAIGGVARALLLLDGPPGREALREVIDAPFTSQAVRAAMNEVLEAAEAAAEVAEDE